MKNPIDGFSRRMLAFADKHRMLPQGHTVLVALSGGRDSMALLDSLLELADARHLTVKAAHYNHLLRGQESQRDQEFVSRWCLQRGVPLVIGRGDVAAQAAAEKRGLEETARTMRYAFLKETARQLRADAVATAHNADDNLETILLHLIRGAGLDGLTGIPPSRDGLIRPLLDTPRSEIDAYLARRGVPYVEDSSNRQPIFARNRLRQEVLPVLRAMNPNVSATVAANLVHLREDRDYLAYLAGTMVQEAEIGKGDVVSLPAAALAKAPHPVAVRAVRQCLAKLGRFQVSAVHLDSILLLAMQENPSGLLSLPQGLTVWREYDRLILSLYPPATPLTTETAVAGPGQYKLDNGWTVTLTEGTAAPPQGPYHCFLDPDTIRYPLTVRARRTGDTLRLPGRHTKTLKKWHMDEKIPRRLRDGLPVLADETGVLAAAGLGPQESRTAQPGAQALAVTFTPPEQIENGKDDIPS